MILRNASLPPATASNKFIRCKAPKQRQIDVFHLPFALCSGSAAPSASERVCVFVCDRLRECLAMISANSEQQKRDDADWMQHITAKNQRKRPTRARKMNRILSRRMWAVNKSRNPHCVHYIFSCLHFFRPFASAEKLSTFVWAARREKKEENPSRRNEHILDQVNYFSLLKNNMSFSACVRRRLFLFRSPFTFLFSFLLCPFIAMAFLGWIFIRNENALNVCPKYICERRSS